MFLSSLDKFRVLMSRQIYKAGAKGLDLWPMSHLKQQVKQWNWWMERNWMVKRLLWLRNNKDRRKHHLREGRNLGCVKGKTIHAGWNLASYPGHMFFVITAPWELGVSRGFRDQDCKRIRLRISSWLWASFSTYYYVCTWMHFSLPPFLP